MSVVRNDADYYLIISSILFFIFFGCRYENLLRVTEASEEVEEGHLVAGGAVARLGAQYSADDYQVIKRIRSTAAAEANRQQRKTDPPNENASISVQDASGASVSTGTAFLSTFSGMAVKNLHQSKERVTKKWNEDL